MLIPIPIPMLIPMPLRTLKFKLTPEKHLQTPSRRTVLLSAFGLSASLLTANAVQDRFWAGGDDSDSWSLWVNSQFLPARVDDLIAKLQTNPGRFSFNYALVEGEVAQAQKMHQFKRDHALQLEELVFKTWQDAHKALFKAHVDMFFAPKHLNEMFTSLSL